MFCYCMSLPITHVKKFSHQFIRPDKFCEISESRPKIIMQIRFNEAIVNVETTDELLNMVR